MPISKSASNSENPPYSTSPLLAQLDCIAHGFFGSRGGVSQAPYRSLNCGHSSMDAKPHIEENRRRVATCFGLAPDLLYSLKQAHTQRVVELNEDSSAQFETVADGMVSSTPGIGLGALGADCAPVLFVDPLNGVIGAAHSGWKGALNGINEAVILAMQGLGAQLEYIHAAIGPAMQQQHYEVQVDFRRSFARHSPIDSAVFFSERSGSLFFDTPGYISARLKAAGIETVDQSGHDTYSQAGHYFSYRRSCGRNEADYGRQIAVICLNEPAAGKR